METKGINIQGVPQTAIRVVTSPASFFREMPRTGGYLEPLIFMAVMGVISGIIMAVLSLLGLQIGAAVGQGIASIVLIPILVAIFGFVGAAILFVIWKLMGSNETYETAYRCGAYLTALSPITTVLGLIPYAGGALGIALMTYYLVIASGEVHQIPSQKAWLVFGIIGALFVVGSITSEMAARRLSQSAEKFQKQMDEASRGVQKGVEESRRAAEKMQRSRDQTSEEAGKAGEEMQRQVEEMRKQIEEMQKQQSRQ